MGFIYTELILENPEDVTLSRVGFIKPEEVRRVTVNALVDTGAVRMVISEELRQKLGLRIIEKGTSTVAGDSTVENSLAEAVNMYWKDRTASQRVLVLPKQKVPLMGALVLEEMDLMPDPLHETVVGRHGDKPMSIIM